MATDETEDQRACNLTLMSGVEEKNRVRVIREVIAKE